MMVVAAAVAVRHVAVWPVHRAAVREGGLAGLGGYNTMSTIHQQSVGVRVKRSRLR